MTHADERIGANLSQLRGDMSQAALASAMRERGWKWSQPTVAEVEKGKRPLKLAEAESIVGILGIEDLEDLTTRPLESIWWARMATVARAAERLEGAAASYLRARAELAEISDRIESAGQAVPEGDQDESEFWIRQGVEEITKRAVPGGPMTLEPSHGRHVRMLFNSDWADYAARFWDVARQAESDPAAALKLGEMSARMTGADDG